MGSNVATRFVNNEKYQNYCKMPFLNKQCMYLARYYDLWLSKEFDLQSQKLFFKSFLEVFQCTPHLVSLFYPVFGGSLKWSQAKDYSTFSSIFILFSCVASIESWVSFIEKLLWECNKSATIAHTLIKGGQHFTKRPAFIELPFFKNFDQHLGVNQSWPKFWISSRYKKSMPVSR